MKSFLLLILSVMTGTRLLILEITLKAVKPQYFRRLTHFSTSKIQNETYMWLYYTGTPIWHVTANSTRFKTLQQLHLNEYILLADLADKEQIPVLQ